MEFKYVLKNLINLDEKDLRKYEEKISKIDGVEGFTVNGETITISARKEAYEYDVLQTLIAISDEYDIEVIFGEDADNRPIDGDLAEDKQVFADEKDAQDETEEGLFDGKIKKAKPDEELIYEDRLNEDRTTLRKESLFRLGELGVSLILFIASLFFKATNSVLSFKMILIILSFSISGYDVVLNAGFDIVKKKFFNGNIFIIVSAVALIILNEPILATIFLWVFACAKFVEGYLGKVRELKKTDLFYVGTKAVNICGEEKKREDIKALDQVTVTRGDRIPTDGVLISDCEISSYKIDRNLKTEYFSGEEVKAGSVVISDQLTYTSKVNFGESYVDKKREDFENVVETFGNEKFEKVSKIGLYADFCVVIVALLTAFLLPAFSATYLDGLMKWGKVAASFIAVATVSASITCVLSVYKNCFVDGYSADIDFLDLSSLTEIGNANSLKISCKSLCDFGKKVSLKEDSLGALNELNALGVKKVSTDFDCDVPNEVKRQIDFIEPTLKNEKVFTFYDDEGTVSFNGEGAKLLNGEISFLPLAYKMAKKACAGAKLSGVISIILRGICVAGVYVFAVLSLNPTYFAIAGAIISLIQALILSAGFTKNK